MDVWFDSGTSWTQAAENESTFLTPQVDVYLEGTDQHRGWFQSSLLAYIASQEGQTTLSLSPQAPFRTLITHGFTMDDKGLKMSKSVGNVVGPDQIMEGTLLPPVKRKGKHVPVRNGGVPTLKYDAMGPDALRLWVASSDFTKDISLGQTVLKAINGALSKFRVTFKMLLGLLHRYEPVPLQIPFHELGVNHQIILVQLRQSRELVINHNRNFEYNKAMQVINAFVNTNLSAFYIETIKDTMYADEHSTKMERPKAQALYTLWQIFRVLQDMLAPVTPLLVEEVWDYTTETMKTTSVHPLRRTSNPLSEEVDAEEHQWSNEQMRTVDLPILLQINDVVKGLQEAMRSEKRMGSSLQSFVLLQLEASTVDSLVFQVLQRHQDQLATLFVISRVSLCIGNLPTAVEDSVWRREGKTTVDGLDLKIHVYAPTDAKCVRCWRYAVSADKKAEEALCDRCDQVIEALRVEKPELFTEHAVNVAAVGA